MPDKIACDIDGVLIDFHTGFLNFARETYGIEATYKDFQGFGQNFWKDGEEYDARMAAFYNSKHSQPLVHEGAQEYLEKLASEGWWIEAITSRPGYMHERTQQELDSNFPGVFKAIDFSVNKDGKRKLDLCKKRGLTILIEDIPKYAAECAAAGMTVFLFDREWNREFDETKHKHITRVSSWKQIYELLQKL